MNRTKNTKNHRYKATAVLALLLAVCMVCTFIFPASAAEDSMPDDTGSESSVVEVSTTEDSTSNYASGESSVVEVSTTENSTSDDSNSESSADRISQPENKVATLSDDTTTDNGNQGTIRDYLDGDWAYITEFKMKDDTATDSKTSVRTGTSPWDADDNAGNDSTDTNNVLRTFDTATYTVQFNTKLREAIARQDVGGIKEGRLYFEFVLPLSEEDARFETDSMGWLQSSQNIKYETVTADVNLDGETKSCIVLRGSYTLVPSGSNEAAIGASTNEIPVVIRALRMHNGDKIKPYFTLWLQHNNVGATYNADDDRLPATIVTGTNTDCPTVDTYGNNETEEHGVEAQTVEGTEIIISARLMLNIQVTDILVNNTKVGAFDFSTGDKNDANYDRGKVKGRMILYGILIEARGKSSDQGMRGMEIPDTNGTITFDLEMYSEYKQEGDELPEKKEDYQPLFWAGSKNDKSDNIEGRNLSVSNKAAGFVPFSGLREFPNELHKTKTCEDSGTWTFTADKSNKSLVHVSVSGFAFGTHFPHRTASSGSESEYTLYNPEIVKGDYWKIDRAVFSAGKMALVQPYVNSSNVEITQEYADGQFYIRLTDSNMSFKGDTVAQMNNDDDTVWIAQYLKKRGNIICMIFYNKYQGNYDEPLTDGCYETDNDWATVGTELSLQVRMDHDGSEDEYVGIASDNIIKYYGKFFDPTGCRLTGWATSEDYALWGAKPDKTDWANDEEMKKATADDLVWFTSLDDLKAEGYLPVSTMFESRRQLNEADMNHLHFYVDGKIKADCPTNKVYMITRNSYAWCKADVADAVAVYLSKSVDDLTDDDYKNYVKNKLLTHKPGQPNTGKYYKQSGSSDFTEDFESALPFWYNDYYHTGTTGSACANAKAASYPNGVYTPGTGITYYEDSCLVMGYKTSITKQTAQCEQDSTAPKKNYDMNQNQRTVDYELNVRVDRTVDNTGSSPSAAVNISLYVEDTLPSSLTYIDGSARLGGTYGQDPKHQNPGTITDGQQFSSVGSYKETVTTNDDGTTTIRWEFPATLDMNQVTWTQPIRFSCSIGTQGNEETDVKHNQVIDNTAKVWADGDSWRAFSEANGNKSVFGITITKTSALSLSKVSDRLVVEKQDDMGFTMNVGNNSSTERSNTIIAETIPYNNLNRTHFNGDLAVKEFSMAVFNDSGNLVTHNFQFYYSTDPKYAGKLGTDYQTLLEEYQKTNSGATMLDWLSANGWTKLDFNSSTSDVAGLNLYSATNLPNLSGGTQITGIVAYGNLASYATMKLHITLNLPNGEGGDYLVNYLSQDKLSSYARSQIVRRSIEGLTWNDANMNGIQDDSDNNLMSGVKVSLLKKVDNEYIPCYYPNSTIPIKIETGNMVSVLSSASDISTYEKGRYKFTDLSEGTYAVKFEDGSGEISPLLASPVNAVSDDTKDSDGVATYSDDKATLYHTLIEGIVMKPTTELTYGIEESKYHDSGFYNRGAKLPITGTSGRLPYYLTGIIVMLLPPTVLLGFKLFRRKHSPKH
ncbi:MAG: hypothetical protein ACI4XP_01200 [Acutalibacteraceae bacterium]